MEHNNTPALTTDNLETLVDKKAVRKLLLNLGFPQHLYGYNYILYALELVFENPETLHHITKEIYPDVAKHFDTTPARVEHSIRSATRGAWSRGNTILINQIFGNSVNTTKGIPTNTHLLAGLYNHLLDERSICAS